MIAKGVVFTSDGEGNKFYIPEDKIYIWSELIDSCGEEDLEVPDWATPVEGEIYIVDIKEKL